MRRWNRLAIWSGHRVSDGLFIVLGLGLVLFALVGCTSGGNPYRMHLTAQERVMAEDAFCGAYWHRLPPHEQRRSRGTIAYFPNGAVCQW